MYVLIFMMAQVFVYFKNYKKNRLKSDETNPMSANIW